MPKDIYIVYETTNLINGKYYIGVHKINGSGYLGSGKLLKQAIKKYGRDNFIRETIQEFTNQKDAYRLERVIINKKFIESDNNYNLMYGGLGRPSGVSFSDNHRLNISKSLKINHHDVRGKNNPMYGKKHTPESIYKMRQSQLGDKHHRYNKRGVECHDSKKWFINGKLFYSSREAGKYFNVNHKTIMNWCKTNTPHCYSI